MSENTDTKVSGTKRKADEVATEEQQPNKKANATEQPADAATTTTDQAKETTDTTTEPPAKAAKTAAGQSASEAVAKKVAVDEQLAKKIMTQVEYYFGDANYSRDKFLLAEADKDPERWVNISVLLTFNRLKEMTTEVGVVAASMDGSTSVEVSEDNTKVRRRKPLEKVNFTPRMIFSKTYPSDVTWEKISEFWTQIGPVVSTKLMRSRDKKFTGSVFVTFETEESAQKAVESGLKFGDTELTTMLKVDWQKQVMAERKEREEKKKQEKEEKKEKSEEKKATYTSGCIVKIDGIGEIESRDDLKALLEPFGHVQYVDYPNGAEKGCVRFADPEGAKATLEAFADGKRELFGKVATVTPMEGDEEKEYWAQVQQRSAANKKNKRGSTETFYLPVRYFFFVYFF